MYVCISIEQSRGSPERKECLGIDIQNQITVGWREQSMCHYKLHVTRERGDPCWGKALLVGGVRWWQDMVGGLCTQLRGDEPHTWVSWPKPGSLHAPDSTVH